MKFKPTNRLWLSVRRARRAFTLAEVLAALAFMAIVIPVAIEGLRVASLAGEVGMRKTAAARVANRVLNELIATGAWQNSASGGTVREGRFDYQWSLQTESWTVDAMRLVRVQVVYLVQGRQYDVNLATLVGNSSL
jgi:general secretion pathway protein I